MAVFETELQNIQVLKKGENQTSSKNTEALLSQITRNSRKLMKYLGESIQDENHKNLCDMCVLCGKKMLLFQRYIHL